MEELLARRLQRVPGLLVLPTIRLYQGRQELADSPAELPAWPAVARGMGATFLLTGRCSGCDGDVQVEVSLQELTRDSDRQQRETLPGARLFEALDRATRWVLAYFQQPEPPEALAQQLFAPPSRSTAALEYYARALRAARQDQPQQALRYAAQAVDYDRRFRPAVLLLAQLESPLGPSGRGTALRRLANLADLARFENDPFDRIRGEIAQSMLLLADGAFEAACTRAETALALAFEQRDTYGQMAAVAVLCDLHLLRPMPVHPEASLETRRTFVLENAGRAAQWQELLVEMHEDLMDLIGGLPAINKLALIYERLDQPEKALAMHRRTLACSEQLGSRRHQATAWLYIGQWYRQQQRWQDALDAISRCLGLADEAAKPAVRISLGGVYLAMQLHEEALAQFELAYEQVRRTDDMAAQFACLREIATTRMKLGRREKAIAALQEAIDIAHALELRDEQPLQEQLDRWKAGGT